MAPFEPGHGLVSLGLLLSPLFLPEVVKQRIEAAMAMPMAGSTQGAPVQRMKSAPTRMAMFESASDATLVPTVDLKVTAPRKG